MRGLQCLSFFIASAYSACQDGAPLALPISNVMLPGGKTMRGIPVQIGTPPQNFSMMPHTFLNDTWVFNTSAPWCFEGTTDAQCFIQRGGQYDPAKSSSASYGMDVYAAGGDPSDTLRQLQTHIWFSSWAKDTIQVGNASLAGFPFGMPGFDYGGFYDPQGNIGLGRNSTMLNALVAAKQIPSRTFSYWWGRNSASDEQYMDGQIVFGGYDAAKTTGPNITQKILPWTLSCPSGMQVTVSSAQLDFPNGTRADFVGGSTITGCLQPDWPTLMTLRYTPYFERFQVLTDTYELADGSGNGMYAGRHFSPNNVYPGDLTITLNEGLKFVVQNDILVLPSAQIGPTGDLIKDAQDPVVMLSPTSDINDNDGAIIGRPFFSSTYLMVDLDAGTFTFWAANATTDSRLVAVGDECATQQEPVVNAATPSSTASSSASSGAASSTSSATQAAASTTGNATAPGTSSHSASLTSPATIAGIAVGGTVAIATLVGLMAWFLIRRGHRKACDVSETNMPLSKYGHDSDSQMWHDKFASPTSLQEMHASQNHPHELWTRERAQEVPGGLWDRRPVEMPAYNTPKK